MKLNVIDYSNLKQEVVVGDIVKADGRIGKVKTINPNNKVGILEIDFKERGVEFWEIAYVCLLKPKKLEVQK